MFSKPGIPLILHEIIPPGRDFGIRLSRGERGAKICAIVAHIENETRKINALIGKYERELALLEEYHVSLILYAVSGKIDVRGLAEDD